MLCSILGHKRDRHAVWHDGVDFRARCTRCGIDMLKDWNDGWRPFDPTADADPGRKPRL